VLEGAGLRGGLDECAVLIAHAEIEEALDRLPATTDDEPHDEDLVPVAPQ